MKYLVSSLANRKRAADICRTTTIHNPVIDDKIPYSTDGIVQCPLRLIDNLKGE